MSHSNHSDSGELIFSIDEDKFQEQVIEASKQTPILVDFWADWCGPCLVLGPVLDKVIPEYAGKVKLAKIDADENMKLCGHYRLRGFPTVLLFIDGEEVDRFASAHPPQYVRDFLDRHLPL